MANTLNPQELHRRISLGEHFRLIDVRTPQEFAEAHIPGTLNIPMEQVEARLADFGQKETAILVCQSGRRAAICMEILEGMRPDMLLLEGGTQAWRNAGFEVVGNRATRLPLMRQVQLTAGVILMVSVVLAVKVNILWLFLSFGVGLGIFTAGLTGYCAMASIMAIMPWNRATTTTSAAPASKGA